ncbi:MAG TPA: YceI family protein [Acidimicrobiales bacterium]|nr:YceI family protein [Acidimicrobiales bacterium]
MSHSAVEFSVRHLGLVKVRGGFDRFRGTIEIGKQPMDSRVEVAIDASSVDTRDAIRDEHLRSPDFLDVGRYPTIEFRSRRVRSDAGHFLVDGHLTVRGVTRPVTLEVTFEGSTRDAWGETRIGFTAATEIDRDEFRLTWNRALEGGGWLIGKQVTIELSVEAVRRPT